MMPADVGEFASVYRYAVVGPGIRLFRLCSRVCWSPKVCCPAGNRGMAARRSCRCASFDGSEGVAIVAGRCVTSGEAL